MLARARSHGAAIVPQGGNTGLVGGGVPRDARGAAVAAAPDRASARSTPRSGRSTAGAGVTLAALQALARAAGLDADARLRRPRLVHRRRRRRLRRRRRPGAAPRHRPRPRRGPGGGAGRRHGRLAAGRADQGQRRLRPAGAAGRLGGDARGHHAGALEAVAAAAVARDRAGAAGVSRRGRRAAGLAARRTRRRWRAATSSSTTDSSSCSTTSSASPRSTERAPFYVITECAAQSDPTDELAEALGQAGDRGRARRRRHRRPRRAVAAARGPRGGDQRRRDPAQARRRRAPGRAGSVPERGARSGAGAPAAQRAILFGHLGDGNVHVNVLGADPDDSARRTTRCSSWCSSAAARSAPSTASAWPRRAGSERARGAAEVAAMRGDQARARPREPPEPRRRPIALIAHTIRGSRAAPPPIAT